MASLNRVQIIGHLGRDPEIKSFNNGGKIASLRVATSEIWKDKQSGERKEKTEWHSVTIHAEHAVKFAEQYLKKGAMVYIEGALETRKWEKNGEDRYSTEIVVRPYNGELKSLDKRESSGGGGRNDDDRGYQRPEDRGGSRSSGAGGGKRSYAEDDQEIPF